MGGRPLLPLRKSLLDLVGCRVHYVDEGEGPVLLMLHGNPTWSFLYRELISGLRERFRCVALDYPGFGLSNARPGYRFTPREHAEVVEEALLALDLTEVVLVMQDWGGPIGLAVAGRHPDRMRALVVGNSWAWPVDDNPRFTWFARVMGGPPGRLAIRRCNAFVELFLRSGVRRGKLPPEVFEHYRRPFPTPASREPTAVFPRHVTASSDFLAEVEAGIAALTDLPVLLLWGDRDPAFRATERRRFEQRFPRSQVVELGGAGHYIQEDAPGEMVASILEWWDGT